MKRYYINGKQYVPEKSAMLCSGAGIMEKSALYRTQKGAYFLVGESVTEGEWAKVITEEAALSYMNENAAVIHTDNYDAVFGEPEEG